LSKSGLRRPSPLTRAMDFRSEYCTGGESMAAQRLNCFLAPTHQHQAPECVDRPQVPFNKSLVVSQRGNEPSLPSFDDACSIYRTA